MSNIQRRQPLSATCLYPLTSQPKQVQDIKKFLEVARRKDATRESGTMDPGGVCIGIGRMVESLSGESERATGGELYGGMRDGAAS